MRLDFARLACRVYLSQHRVCLIGCYLRESAAVEPRAYRFGIFERSALPFDIRFDLREQ